MPWLLPSISQTVSFFRCDFNNSLYIRFECNYGVKGVTKMLNLAGHPWGRGTNIKKTVSGKVTHAFFNKTPVERIAGHAGRCG
jgi:hypothetical protein